ncbi:MAG: helix-turn-helix transcriptional regulator [Clostridia bacterium]|nr:helix-turn-helix transcriptional regulator [Clostridia bacterium]
MTDNTAAPCCESSEVHKDLVDTVAKGMPSIDTLYDLAELYKVFGDSTRIRILYVLLESEVCVCDIADVLDMTVSAISHQLRVLKNAGLVKFRKQGKVCYYSLADNHVKTIIAQGIEHVTE